MDAPTIPNWLLEKFPPSRDLLLRLLISPIPEQLLREIAGCDYGCDYLENLEVLMLICRNGNVPTPLEWNPREVCCLTRWSEVRNVRSPDQKAIVSFHRKRAFACCILIMAAADDTNATEIHTIIQLVESVIAIELPKFAEAAICLLVSRLTSGPDIEGTNRPFFAFAVILLALLNKPFRVSTSQISLLVDWIMSEESFSRSRQIELWEWDSAGSEWLIGLGCDGPAKWVVLAQRLSADFPVFEPLVSRMAKP